MRTVILIVHNLSAADRDSKSWKAADTTTLINIFLETLIKISS